MKARYMILSFVIGLILLAGVMIAQIQTTQTINLTPSEIKNLTAKGIDASNLAYTPLKCITKKCFSVIKEDDKIIALVVIDNNADARILEADFNRAIADRLRMKAIPIRKISTTTKIEGGRIET